MARRTCRNDPQQRNIITMTKDKILLIGGGGHCKSAIDVIELTGKFEIVGIIDIKEKVGDLLFGYPIIGTDSDISSLQKNINAFHITLGMIGPSDKRSKLFNELKNSGLKFPVIQSPLAYVSKHAKIGNGTIIMHHAIVNAGATVGENCILNTKSLIEHDARIGSHSHIATGAIINGGVTVGEGSFIGSGSVSKQGSIVPANSFIKANTIIK
jgi:sugar O-acyltransferase (sialic acid O-acetyltransferase NeuD family)